MNHLDQALTTYFDELLVETPVAEPANATAGLDRLLAQVSDNAPEVMPPPVMELEPALQTPPVVAIEAPEPWQPAPVEVQVNPEPEQTDQMLTETAEPAHDALPVELTAPANEVDAEEFQALFFKVSGLTLAVPLAQLGAIYELDGALTRLPGRPRHVMGVSEQRGERIQAVNTASLVMPESYASLDQPEQHYQFLVKLGDSHWALACDELSGTRILRRDSVKWRSGEGKRPWLAGMVIEQMCALLEVDELIGILEAKN